MSSFPKLGGFTQTLFWCIFLISNLSWADEGIEADGPLEPTRADVETTIVYGEDFFNRYPNAQTAADLVNRIPGGRQIIGGGGGGVNQRGFSNNNDGVLINGRRVTGKDNNSQSVLGRITRNQVQHIELIRGGSPDIKSASQSAMINIVTKGDGTSGSGTWSAKIITTDGGYVRPGVKASYSGQSGQFEYFLSGELTPDNLHGDMRDEFYDINGDLTEAIDFEVFTKQNRVNLSGNMTYELSNGDLIRLNGVFKTGTKKLERLGSVFNPNGSGELVFNEYNKRFETYKKPNWELGGDYGTKLSDNWVFKLIGLYANKKNNTMREEDFDHDEDNFLEDFRSFSTRHSTEAISRFSLGWSGLKGHDIEFGSEVAVNILQTDLEYFDRENGPLLEVEIDNSAISVKETRVESFVNDTWKISNKTTLEGLLIGEYSKIGVTGDATNNRTFFFLRPSLDLRYDINPTNQIKALILREVGQMNFSDFSSSVSQDDEVVEGNEELVPWKNWRFELNYEHRLANDAGSIKLIGFDDYTSDIQDRSETSPGVSGKVNVGDARFYGVELEASFRLGFLGVPDAVLDISGKLTKAYLTDAFTGVKRTPSWWSPKNVRFQFRHDVNDWGLYYEINFMISNPSNYVDLNEISDPTGPRYMLWGSVEKRLTKNLILRFGAGPIFNVNSGRDRMIYEAGIASGIITSRELRTRNDGKRFRFTLKGTF